LVDLGGRGRRRRGRQRGGLVPLRLRRPVGSERRVARYAWPAGVGATGLAWYAADSLRHRREGGRGYRLHGAEALDPAGDGFLRAAEALTSAPISWGSDVELLINGDRIFPCMIETIRGAERTLARASRST
jgi:hypothetical protein